MTSTTTNVTLYRCLDLTAGGITWYRPPPAVALALFPLPHVSNNKPARFNKHADVRIMPDWPNDVGEAVGQGEATLHDFLTTERGADGLYHNLMRARLERDFSEL